VEYIAFLFLGGGVLLVLGGVLLNANENRSTKAAPLDEYLKSSSVQVAPPQAAPKVAPINAASVPGAFQFVSDAPAIAKSAPITEVENSPVQVAVNVQKSNPRLFEKFAFLYLDSSAKNVYEGSTAQAAFEFTEVAGIRRFGRGVFAYDGFGFFFDHSGGQERFPLGQLKTVGFYPNCVALTPRGNLPVALLFMEETESIRKVLETFQSTDARV